MCGSIQCLFFILSVIFKEEGDEMMSRWMYTLLFFISLFMSSWVLMSSSWAQEYSWGFVEELIIRRFPHTPTIDIHTFTQWKSSNTLHIVDVRPQKEFQVGHIQKAKNWENTAVIQQHVRKEERLVLYCSVGYRSAEIVQQLQELGYERVYNLKGAIFMWVNMGNAVYRGEQSVETVHPYNELWGGLLNKRYHAYE
jgi:rhodanese-related sulfurtransferase